MFLDLAKKEEKLIFADKPNVERHRFVGTMRTAGDDRKIVLSRYSIYTDSLVPALWPPEWSGGEAPTASEVFPDLPMSGYTLTVTAMPYDAAVTAKSSGSDDPTDLFADHDGLEVRLVRACSQALGFSFRFVNPADQMWGSVDPDTNQWNGMLRNVMDFEADLAISGIGRMLKREQLLHQSRG